MCMFHALTDEEAPPPQSESNNEDPHTAPVPYAPPESCCG